MPDVKHIHLLPLFQDPINHTIDVRLVAIQQVPEIRIFTCHGAPIRILLKAEDGLLEAPVPFQGSAGVLGVDFVVEICEVALGAGSDLNEICYAGLQIRRKTPLPS